MAIYDEASGEIESLNRFDLDILKIRTEIHSNPVSTLVETISPYGDSCRSEMLAFVPIDVKCVLDVGCHSGAFGRSIKTRSKVEVWGIEPNPVTASVAAQSLDRVLNDVFTENLAIPDQYFDAIIFVTIQPQ